jgi:polysaccharide export outer membrane protein
MDLISRNRAPAVLAAFLLALLVVGCASKGATPPPEPVPGNRDDYVIGVADLLKIVVWRNPELTVDVPVRRDGKISVPLVDDIQAEGLTPEELKEVLTESLAEYVTAPDVTVIVLQTLSHTVTVAGGVARSGQIPLVREMRVLDAIAQMGGFNAWARRNSVRIFRRENGGMTEYVFNYSAYARGKAPDSNLLLAPGDTIVVPE